jgi:hypothetical protein
MVFDPEKSVMRGLMKKFYITLTHPPIVNNNEERTRR